jgi:hypothetical protein
MDGAPHAAATDSRAGGPSEDAIALSFVGCAASIEARAVSDATRMSLRAPEGLRKRDRRR